MKMQIKILFFLAILLMFAAPVWAYSSFYSSRCATCHTDDSFSCDGCHRHRGNITALVDQDSYAPGTLVTVTVNGGSRGGWVRGLLKDANGNELARVGGPTGTGDDGLGSPVVFPFTIEAAAPTTPGTYTWQAGWYGGSDNGGGVHVEDLENISVVVTGASSVPDEVDEIPTWGGIKALYR